MAKVRIAPASTSQPYADQVIDHSFDVEAGTHEYWCSSACRKAHAEVSVGGHSQMPTAMAGLTFFGGLTTAKSTFGSRRQSDYRRYKRWVAGNEWHVV